MYELRAQANGDDVILDAPPGRSCQFSCQGNPDSICLEPKSVPRLFEAFGEISPINSHKDRSFVSLVCKDWYNIKQWSRRHVFIGNYYSAPPKIVARRIPQIRSVTLIGKPRFSDFNLVPEDWGADVHPWLSVLAKAYPFLVELRLKRMAICYSLQISESYFSSSVFQYPLNQLQLFGNVPAIHHVDPVNYPGREHNSPAFRPNKRSREVETNLMQKKLPISLNQKFYNEESDHPSSIPNPHTVSNGLKLSYDDEERNSLIISASGSMTGVAPLMSSDGDSFTTELDRQNEELERYIMLHKKEYEVTLVGAFRREKDKDLTLQAVTAESQAAMKLAKQREDEIHGLKLRLRFRKAAVKKLEGVDKVREVEGNPNFSNKDVR
ncbi:unnamed protein product [Lactuca saligna]|uniref:Uncharacterized protein n=1 Tax=Lactuca saligna TaxID=75948 RepID=A0AA36EAX1_LACSI|nr:unnamed protein product [Lactuca saligna]